MRILMLTKYGRLGASSRLRSFQYVPVLEEAGFSVQVSPLLDDIYVEQMYTGSIDHARVAAAYARRCRALLRAGNFDLVWVEKEALPWVPGPIELPLLGRSAPLVVDYDDAMFHRYDKHSSRLVRAALGQKIDAVMARADLVTAGNEYLAQRARDAGAARVEILPTVVDLMRYPEPTADRSSDRPVVGWIGSPDTVRFLSPLFGVFERLAFDRPVRLIAVGARPDQVAGSVFEPIPWNEISEVGLLRTMDVGIMPLQDTPWQRGKCGYKLIQYMACGLPVVAAPVGVNATLVKHGENGFLARTESEWLSALHALLDDHAMGARFGMAGRRQVEDVYSLQKQGPRMVEMFENLLGRVS